MKVLWISNIPFGPLCDLAGQNKSASGSWLDASYDSLLKEKNIEITLVTVSRVNEIKALKEGNHSFYILPGGYPSEYDHTSLSNKKVWEIIKTECQPDLIQIWGTEYTHGYLALQVMKDIPAVIYMQGLMSQVANHYLSGMTDAELRQSITIRDIIKWDWIKRQQARYKKGSFFEAKMLELAGNVIVENNWCASHCVAIAHDTKVFKSKLIIKKEFYNNEWDINKMKPYTIMCNAAGYPIKGLHILLKALHIIKKKHTNVQLIIPGEKSPFQKSIVEKIKINGYTKFIMALIEKFQLKDNVVFLGNLTSVEMAAQMANSNVFVMPSSIENHSSTLIEAMIVGTPCVSSYVGGVSEYLNHNVNGLIYRFDEHEILASYVDKIFSDQLFAAKIALEGKLLMRASRNSNNLKDEFMGIYHNILNSNN
jgi:glycosyltransferase involved in cell wall biosynthesis